MKELRVDLCFELSRNIQSIHSSFLHDIKMVTENMKHLLLWRVVHQVLAHYGNVMDMPISFLQSNNCIQIISLVNGNTNGFKDRLFVDTRRKHYRSHLCATKSEIQASKLTRENSHRLFFWFSQWLIIKSIHCVYRYSIYIWFC